jgi:hypothetical protein
MQTLFFLNREKEVRNRELKWNNIYCYKFIQKKDINQIESKILS